MNALRTASLISLIMTIAKGFAFASSGSIVVLASFMDSLMDSLLSWVNLKLSSAAKEHADHQHPYGHGGFEVVGTMIQGFLIAGSGGLVLFQTLDRVFSPASHKNLDLDKIPMALGVLVMSTLGGGLITWILAHSKKKVDNARERSLSLNADFAHYTGDLILGLVGILGMLVTIWTQNPYVDALTGGVSGLLLIRVAYPLIRDGLRDIMNTAFDPKLQADVQDIVMNTKMTEVKGMHRLRSRTLGPNHFVDFHLKLPNEILLHDAHDISYRLECLIKEKIPQVDVMIHLDPEDEPDEEL